MTIPNGTVGKFCHRPAGPPAGRPAGTRSRPTPAEPTQTAWVVTSMGSHSGGPGPGCLLNLPVTGISKVGSVS